MRVNNTEQVRATPPSVRSRMEIVRNLTYEAVLKGFTAAQVRDYLERRGHSFSQSTVNKYVGEVRKEMKDARTRSMQERLDSEVAVLEYIRNRALDTFERSQEDDVTTELVESVEPMPIIGRANGGVVTDPTAAADAGNMALQHLLNGGGVMQQVSRTTKEKRRAQAGDPRALQVAIQASQAITKLLGVDPIEVRKVEISNADDFSIEELRNMEPSQLAELISREADSS